MDHLWLSYGSAGNSLWREHRSNRHDHHVRLWMLLNLELWHQLYIDGIERGAIVERLQDLCLPQ